MLLALLLACPTQVIGGDDDTDKGIDDADADADADADGDPVVDSTLIGRVYQISLANATIEEPAGVGSLLGGYIEQDLLVEVTAADATTISFLGALSDADARTLAQDTCVPTVDISGGDFTNNPEFDVGPTDLAFPVSDASVTIEGAVITGTFVDGGDTISDGVMEGLVDVRDLEGAVGMGADQICSLVGSFGASCEPCPDGEEYCLGFRAVDIEAPWIDDLDLVEIIEVSESCP